MYSAQDGRRTCDAGGVILSRMAGTVGYYSALHLGFTQRMLLPAAIAAESAIEYWQRAGNMPVFATLGTYNVTIQPYILDLHS